MTFTGGYTDYRHCGSKRSVIHLLVWVYLHGDRYVASKGIWMPTTRPVTVLKQCCRAISQEGVVMTNKTLHANSIFEPVFFFRVFSPQSSSPAAMKLESYKNAAKKFSGSFVPNHVRCPTSQPSPLSPHRLSNVANLLEQLSSWPGTFHPPVVSDRACMLHAGSLSQLSMCKPHPFSFFCSVFDFSVSLVDPTEPLAPVPWFSLSFLFLSSDLISRLWGCYRACTLCWTCAVYRMSTAVALMFYGIANRMIAGARDLYAALLNGGMLVLF